ncbi:hypothetical protein HOS33_gp299 [Erwinia phage vB_EamM_Y3]|uniref:Uncharacterized protein n=1 Tax=Erwinia phage vB_EamM_Y3 TaxID=1983553 RepID=A0A2H4IBL7_9CAUD|nr:hypothetical protein HOS33_gp299 [Erwinia phage vB_EamM_Y3]ARW58939.1 hypothetical protein Y3_299 [Erwinia phage vB_EamM_Y3]QZE56159.1 hypothetical protein pEaSNUABM52_00301 [Erwinia phage pEp_SNUABM_52]
MSKGNFMKRLEAGETFYMYVSGKDCTPIALGHDANITDLRVAIGGLAFAHNLKKVKVSFSRNIMADPDGVVYFDIVQTITVKKEKVY